MTHPLFTNVTQDSLTELEFSKKHFKKGSTLYEQGTLCNGLDMVIDGTLVAYALADNGSETRVFQFEKGSVIGANLLFGDANHYPLNLYTLTDCTLIHVTKSQVTHLLKDPEFVLNFVRHLSMNAQNLNKRLAMYHQKSLRENLTDYLLALSCDQKSSQILLPISKKQLADYLGVQRPSLFRTLKQLEDEGWILSQNRRITLLDAFKK